MSISIELNIYVFIIKLKNRIYVMFKLYCSYFEFFHKINHNNEIILLKS
jgi:hypothetical protein